MLDAAAAMEAYDASAKDDLMIDRAWTNAPQQYWASDWHLLFNGEVYTNDVRRPLNWRGRFDPSKPVSWTLKITPKAGTES